MSDRAHDDSGIPADATLLRGYGELQLIPPLDDGESLETVGLEGLTARLGQWGFKSINDRYSLDIGISVFVDQLLRGGREALLARFNEVAPSRQMLVALTAGHVRDLEVATLPGQHLGVVMAPILDPEDPFFLFSDAHAHVLRPDRQRFGKSLEKKVCSIATVVLF